MTGGPLYSDNLVRVDPDSITFFDYYFPAGDKTLPLDRIGAVYWYKPEWLTGKYRFWGSGDFRTWCPRDYRRHRRDRMFLVIKRDGWTRIAFTVEDSGRFMKVLGELGISPHHVDGLRRSPKEPGKAR
jgi:hypothetical protein